jgi:PAS domain S-box-containing protein
MMHPGGLDLALMTAAFETQPDAPFFIKDAQLRYVAVNSAMVRLTGARSSHDLIGQTAQRYFDTDLARHFEALDRQVLRTGRPLPDRLELVLPTRRPARWLLFSRLPVRDDHGTIIGILAAARLLPATDAAGADYGRLAGVLAALTADPAAPHRIADLAQLAGCSLSQLEREFRRMFSITPQAFLQKLRLDRAMECLGSGMSVAETAYACGYADHSAFTRRFKAATGLTPRAYQRTRTAS